MAIAFTKLFPSVRQIFRRGRGGGLILVDGFGLAPDADIGIPLLDPLDKVVVVVVLICPHSILDIPQEHTQRRFILLPLIQLRHLDTIDIEAVNAIGDIRIGDVDM